MTPREKAIELVEKFSSVLMQDEVYEDSIKCALIAVDECLHTCVESMIYYWQEVKHEIEKL